MSRYAGLHIMELEGKLDRRDARIAELEAALVALRAKLSTPTPGGWRLTPPTATSAMKTAGVNVELFNGDINVGALTWEEVSEIYKAMLAAAPDAPTGAAS